MIGKIYLASSKIYYSYLVYIRPEQNCVYVEQGNIASRFWQNTIGY